MCCIFIRLYNKNCLVSSALWLHLNTVLTMSQDILTLTVPVHPELGKSGFKYSAACKQNELQKAMKLHSLISFEHFKRLYLCICNYTCNCVSWLHKCIYAPMLKLYMFIFLYTGLSWKRDPNLNEITCLNKGLKNNWPQVFHLMAASLTPVTLYICVYIYIYIYTHTYSTF